MTKFKHQIVRKYKETLQVVYESNDLLAAMWRRNELEYKADEQFCTKTIYVVRTRSGK
jgi:hypothetical protein